MYKDMTALLEERELNGFKLSKFSIKPDNFRAMMSGISIGEYVKLSNNGECVMSNTNMEKRTNMDFCQKAHGDVLIGGLGIGLIILAIQDKEEVKSITVLEKNQEVIDMVLPQLPVNEKVKVIKADVFDWKPSSKEKYDCIYMDIWNYINEDVYEEEMKPLKNRYRKYLKNKSESPNRFNFCWAEYEAKNGRRL